MASSKTAIGPPRDGLQRYVAVDHERGVITFSVESDTRGEVLASVTLTEEELQAADRALIGYVERGRIE